jgi:hypothetical protein
MERSVTQPGDFHTWNYATTTNRSSISAGMTSRLGQRLALRQAAVQVKPEQTYCCSSRFRKGNDLTVLKPKAIVP